MYIHTYIRDDFSGGRETGRDRDRQREGKRVKG